MTGRIVPKRTLKLICRRMFYKLFHLAAIGKPYPRPYWEIHQRCRRLFPLRFLLALLPPFQRGLVISRRQQLQDRQRAVEVVRQHILRHILIVKLAGFSVYLSNNHQAVDIATLTPCRCIVSGTDNGRFQQLVRIVMVTPPCKKLVVQFRFPINGTVALEV